MCLTSISIFVIIAQLIGRYTRNRIKKFLFHKGHLEAGAVLPSERCSKQCRNPTVYLLMLNQAYN